MKIENYFFQLFNYSSLNCVKKNKEKVREGQTVDALALGGDEGRDKLR